MPWVLCCEQRYTCPMSKANEQSYIGDLAHTDAKDTALMALGLLVLSVALGFVIGLVVWVVLWASSTLTSLLWVQLPAAFGTPAWLPLLLCPVGGACIGLWTWKFKNPPDHLETVLGSIRETGGYQLKGNLLTSAVSFLLPLVFGGSVGPEAGLTGIIAACCTWIGNTLKSAGVRAKSLADVTVSATLCAVFGAPLLGIAAATGKSLLPGEVSDAANPSEALAEAPGEASGIPDSAATLAAATSVAAGNAAASNVPNAPSSAATSSAAATSVASDNAATPDATATPDAANPSLARLTYRRVPKLIMYTLSALGAFAGILLVKQTLGGGMDMPHFGPITAQLHDCLWVVPCILVAYLMALLFHGANLVFAKASEALGNKPVLKAVLAGCALGLAGTLLPLVLFAGEEQSAELMATWSEIGMLVLLAIALVKILATALCLNFGWNGGQFFPCIFAGVACGYALSCATGADPMLLVLATTSGFLASVTRKPIMTVGLLLLCFPVNGIVWGIVAAFATAKLPVPDQLLPAGD